MSRITLLFLALAGCLEPAGTSPPLPGDPPQDDAPPPEGGVGWTMIEGPLGRSRVPYVVVDGMAIYDGDIVLGPADEIARHNRGAAHALLGRRWTNGIVRYRFHTSVNSYGRSRIEDVLDALEAQTPLRFVNIGNDGTGNFVEYRVSPYDENNETTGVSDQIGMAGGAQAITFNGTPPPASSSRVILHETLHAVGLWHEQSRPDRDAYIRVDPDCIDWSLWPWESAQAQYEIKGDALGLGVYDYRSVMHYRTGAFCQQPAERPAKCNIEVDTDSDNTTESYCKTMLKIGYFTQPIIFGGTTLSIEDANTIFRMYGPQLGDNEANDHFGRAVVSGDFDNDGYDDLAVGIPDQLVANAAGTGQVMIWKGTSARLIPWQVLSQLALSKLPEAGDHFGAALAAGDIDKDGFADLVIGIPGKDVVVGGVKRVDAGAIAIFRGSKNGLVADEQWTQAQDGAGSPDHGDRFGAAVAVGSFTGTSVQIAVGAPGDRNPILLGNTTTASGAVFIFPHDYHDGVIGTPTRLSRLGGIAGDDFGATLAAGRLDENARTDLAVGAPGQAQAAGAVHVYAGTEPSGASNGWSSAALATYVQTVTQPVAAANNRFGAALVIGDLSPSDQRGDLVVGAPGTSSARGAVEVFALATSWLHPTALVPAGHFTQGDAPQSAAEPGDEFGAALAVGKRRANAIADDLAVGAPGEDSGAGAVTLFQRLSVGALMSGRVTFKQSAFLGAIGNSGDRFGAALAFGDFDGSGEGINNEQRNAGVNRYRDLAVGVPGDAPWLAFGSYGPPGAGSVYTLAGTGDALAPYFGYHQAYHAPD